MRARFFKKILSGDELLSVYELEKPMYYALLGVIYKTRFACTCRTEGISFVSPFNEKTEKSDSASFINFPNFYKGTLSDFDLLKKIGFEINNLHEVMA